MTELKAHPKTVRYLCEQYGLKAETGELRQVARGSVGRIWRLDVAGCIYALKELFWGAEERVVRHEVAFRDAGVAAGLRAPASLPTRDATYLCQVPEELGGALVRLYTWIDGPPLHTGQNGQAHWLGQVLGLMHGLRYPVQDPPEAWYEVCPSMADWQELLQLAHGQESPWAPRLKQVLPGVEELSLVVTRSAISDVITCHLDLNPSNVLVNASGDLVIVDWDNAAAGTAERELASALIQWHVEENRPDAVAIRATLDAYAEAGGVGTIKGLSSFAMYLATWINYLYVQAKAAVAAETSAEHRTYAILQVERGVSQLPSRKLLETVGELAQR